ncbi:hypothetical protein BKA62DRAFT_372198 [Auriculariales sp. MPI-PUGE-AT-0066]|nr:hypothetical protein BKA62DRAFT_372198 [Auriculariales sp. MPI-PUGE-AT-0066]
MWLLLRGFLKWISSQLSNAGSRSLAASHPGRSSGCGRSPVLPLLGDARFIAVFVQHPSTEAAAICRRFSLRWPVCSFFLSNHASFYAYLFFLNTTLPPSSKRHSARHTSATGRSLSCLLQSPFFAFAFATRSFTYGARSLASLPLWTFRLLRTLSPT